MLVLVFFSMVASRESSPIRAPQKTKPYQNGVSNENGYAQTNGHSKENGYSLQNGHSHNTEHSDDEYIDTVEVRSSLSIFSASKYDDLIHRFLIHLSFFYRILFVLVLFVGSVYIFNSCKIPSLLRLLLFFLS